MIDRNANPKAGPGHYGVLSLPLQNFICLAIGLSLFRRTQFACILGLRRPGLCVACVGRDSHGTPEKPGLPSVQLRSGPTWWQEAVMAKLTTAKKKAEPASDFGLPEKRKYPMPD